MQPLPFDPVEEARRQWREHGWGPAATGMAAVTSVMRVQQLFLLRVTDELRPLGLTFARFEVLALLAFTRQGQLPLGKIGRRLQVHPTSVTSAIDKLEAQGLVVRTDHPSDRRTTLAEITPDGQSLFERAVGRLNANVFSDVGLSDESAATLIAIMKEIRERAGDFVEKPSSA